jgi:hypothetical protein
MIGFSSFRRSDLSLGIRAFLAFGLAALRPRRVARPDDHHARTRAKPHQSYCKEKQFSAFGPGTAGCNIGNRRKLPVFGQSSMLPEQAKKDDETANGKNYRNKNDHAHCFRSSFTNFSPSDDKSACATSNVDMTNTNGMNARLRRIARLYHESKKVATIFLQATD